MLKFARQHGLTDSGALNLAFFGSLALSVLAVWADPVVDGNGALILMGSELAPLGSDRWLPALISATAGLLGASTNQTGHLYQALFFVWLCLAFVQLVERLGGNPATTWLAAIVILAFPPLNALRAAISFDVAFAALALSALNALLAYRLVPSLSAALSSTVLILCAASLRLEALALFALPIWAKWRDTRPTLRLALGTAIAAALIVLLYARTALEVLQVGADPAASWQSLETAWTRVGLEFHFAVAAMERMLGELAAGFAPAVVIVALFATVLAAMAKTFGVFCVPLIYGLVLRTGVHSMLRAWWWALLGWFILVEMSQTLVHKPAQPALGILPVLLALSAVPFGLHGFLTLAGRAAGVHRLVAAAVLAACVIAGVVGLDLRRDDRYLREAGEWLAEGYSDQTTIFFGHATVAYFAGRPHSLATDRHAWRETMALFWSDSGHRFDLVVAHIDAARRHREQHLLRSAARAPLRSFRNDAGDSVLVFSGRQP